MWQGNKTKRSSHTQSSHHMEWTDLSTYNCKHWVAPRVFIWEVIQQQEHSWKNGPVNCGSHSLPLCTASGSDTATRTFLKKMAQWTVAVTPYNHVLLQGVTQQQKPSRKNGPVNCGSHSLLSCTASGSDTATRTFLKKMAQWTVAVTPYTHVLLQGVTQQQKLSRKNGPVNCGSHSLLSCTASGNDTATRTFLKEWTSELWQSFLTIMYCFREWHSNRNFPERMDQWIVAAIPYRHVLLQQFHLHVDVGLDACQHPLVLGVIMQNEVKVGPWFLHPLSFLLLLLVEFEAEVMLGRGVEDGETRLPQHGNKLGCTQQQCTAQN